MSCEKIDDIFSLLKELENQGYLSATPESHQIQTLKFELRYMRMHLKWATNIYQPLLCNMRIWVENVEKCLLESKRQGIMASKLSKGKFCNLLLIMKVGKAILRKQCTSYYEDEHYGLNLSCKDIPITELLSECIDPLLENLKHLVQCNSLNLLVFPKKQIESIWEKLRYLRKFLEITGTEVHDVLNNVTSNQGFLNKKLELLSRIKRLIENAVYAFCYSWAKAKETRMEQLFFDMQVKINHIVPEVRVIYVKLLKASKLRNAGSLGIDLQALAALDTLLDNLHNLLQEQDAGSMNSLDVHQIEFLQQELSFIKYFLLDPLLNQYFETEPYIFNSLMMQVEVMARGAASHAHFIHNGRKMDEMNLLSSNLVKIVDLLKSKIRKIYEGVPKPSISNFPRVPKLGFLEFVIQKLDELLKHRDDLLTYVKEGFEVVQTELGHLLYFTSDTIKNPTEISRDEEGKEKDKEKIVGLIMEVAYEAEHIIDLISTSNIPNWHCLFWLSDVIEKIRKLRMGSLKVFGEKTCNNILPTLEKASAHDGPSAYNLATETEVVGLDDEAEYLIDHLLHGHDQLAIVSIVGMPGVGKTTLARKVYEHASVTRYFDVHSWYCISQIYDRRDLLLGILSDVTEFSEETQEMDDNDLADALHKSLQHARYLIVLDDIWSIEPWDDIRNLFPDDCNGSRILFTSRFYELFCRAYPKILAHEPRLLSDDESLKLFQNRVFNGGSFPPQLYEIGEEIATECRGFPLALVLITGVLRQEKTKDHWIRVLDSIVKDHWIQDLEFLRVILELSYRYLPDHLKPCFLYLGAFPEDKEIPTWKLIHLWIAEGFIRENESKSLENVAEDYLMELIARGLLLIGKYKSKGGVKSCRVHDLLLDFSSEKGKDENFFMISDQMVNLEQYRHFFYCKHILGRMPSDPYIRSLIFFPTEKKSLSLISNAFYNLNAFDLSIIPHILKLLRVLDLEHIHLDSTKFPADIDLLVHLRYLAVQGRLKHVPSSVANLWRLETFRLVGTGGEVKLPESLLEMSYLKNVYVSNEASFELSDTYESKKSSESDGIEKLSTISLRHGDLTTEKVIKSLGSARKLKCIFLESSDCSTSCSQFPELNLLNKLESLNVTYQGSVRVQHPCDLIFPSNLKKVTLSNFCFPWSEISKLWRLPQLEVLKLLSKAFEGRIWDSRDCKFGKLKFLKLERLDIKKWNASPLAFPCLEKIVLKRCSQLLEIPPSFGELATLRTIQVQWCGRSVVELAHKIQEEQLELGNNGLQVLI